MRETGECRFWVVETNTAQGLCCSSWIIDHRLKKNIVVVAEQDMIQSDMERVTVDSNFVMKQSDDNTAREIAQIKT
jgi:hypothetical protein